MTSRDIAATDAAALAATDDRPVEKGATIAVLLLTLCAILSMFDRVQLSALLPLIKKEFILTDAQLGLLTGTAFSVMYSAAALPMAWMLDRVHRARLLTGALVFWSGMTAVSGLAGAYWHLLAARVGLAAGESALTPAAHSIIADYYPPRKRSFPIGIETAGNGVGIMLGLAVAGWAGAALGWRAALMIAATPGFVVAIAMFFLLREPPRTAVRHAAPAGALGIVRSLWTVRAYRWLVLAGILNTSMTSGLAQWIPSFFDRSHALPMSVVGAWVGVALGLGGSAGAILGGWMANRAAARDPAAPFKLCAVFSSILAPLLVLVLWTGHPYLALAGVGILNIGVMMFVPIVFTGIQNTCDPRFRATAVASSVLINVLVAYGAVPPIIGAISDGLAPSLGVQSLRGAMTAMAAFPLLATFVYWRLSKQKFEG